MSKKSPPYPTSASESLPKPDGFSEVEDEKTDPGLMLQTNNALSAGASGSVDKAIILDVLEHMKKNNSYQKRSNKSQIETNIRMSFLTKVLVLIVIMTVVSLADSVIGRVQYNNVMEQLTTLASDYKELQKQYSKLATRKTTVPLKGF